MVSNRRADAQRVLDHFHGQLVTHHARVGEVGLITLVDVIVGAADADPSRSHQDVTSLGCGRGTVLNGQLTGLQTDEGFDHGVISGVWF